MNLKVKAFSLALLVCTSLQLAAATPVGTQDSTDPECNGETCTAEGIESGSSAGLTVTWSLEEDGESGAPENCSSTCKECKGVAKITDSNVGCSYWLFDSWGGPNDEFPDEEDLENYEHRVLNNGANRQNFDANCSSSEYVSIYIDCGPGWNSYRMKISLRCECDV